MYSMLYLALVSFMTAHRVHKQSTCTRRGQHPTDSLSLSAYLCFLPSSVLSESVDHVSVEEPDITKYILQSVSLGHTTPHIFN